VTPVRRPDRRMIDALAHVVPGGRITVRDPLLGQHP
jgi:hypothetical protein